MKNMKKVMSGMLCAALIASNGISVFAAENPLVKEVTDDQQECTLYDHFDVTYDDFKKAAGADLKATGIEFDEKHQFIYMTAGEYTSYSVMSHAKETKDDVDFVVDYDAKSGRIHSVEFVNGDQAVIEKQFAVSLTALGATEEEIEELSAIIASEEDYDSTETDKFEVSKYVFDTGVDVEIACPLFTQTDAPEMTDANKPECVKATEKLIAGLKDCGSEDFDITYAEFVQAVVPTAKEKGLSIDEADAAFTVFVYDGETNCDVSATTYASDDSDMITYFSIDFDKDNDKLHDVYYDFASIEDSCEMTTAVLTAIGVDDVEAAVAEVKKAEEAGKEAEVEAGDYYLTVDCYDTYYEVSVYKF